MTKPDDNLNSLNYEALSANNDSFGRDRQQNIMARGPTEEIGAEDRDRPEISQHKMRPTEDRAQTSVGLSFVPVKPVGSIFGQDRANPARPSLSPLLFRCLNE